MHQDMQPLEDGAEVATMVMPMAQAAAVLPASSVLMALIDISLVSAE